MNASLSLITNIYNHSFEIISRRNRQLSRFENKKKFKFTIHTPHGYWPFIFLTSDETYGFIHREMKEREKKIMK